jgi:hypothetical protein
MDLRSSAATRPSIQSPARASARSQESSERDAKESIAHGHRQERRRSGAQATM